MKMNKWTMALAAAGVVSLSSVAQAQEAAAGANALAASTTLSGYVSTSYTLDNDTGDTQDSFRLDVVDLKLASAQGEGEYATGYTVELWAGPNAGGLGTGTGGVSTRTVELYQANIDVRLPVGNGLDIKIGQFGTVVGAESNNYTENAFYTRSRAYNTDQPTHHTGVLASYQLSDDASLSVGFVNDTKTNATNAAIRTVEKSLAVAGGQAYFRGLGLERRFRDIQTARYHPIQEPRQHRFSGRIASHSISAPMAPPPTATMTMVTPRGRPRPIRQVQPM